MIKLEMCNVSIGYNHKAVLSDVGFAAAPGQMVGIIGPNGSGKSTIIKALSRVIAPLSGSILLDGRDITAISRRELACLVGVVPQMPLLPSTFTAFEIVLMGRNPHSASFSMKARGDMAIAWRAMEMTRTQSFAQRRVNELSGGEIQRVVIARVLAQEPKVGPPR